MVRSDRLLLELDKHLPGIAQLVARLTGCRDCVQPSLRRESCARGRSACHVQAPGDALQDTGRCSPSAGVGVRLRLMLSMSGPWDCGSLVG